MYILVVVNIDTVAMQEKWSDLSDNKALNMLVQYHFCTRNKC